MMTKHSWRLGPYLLALTSGVVAGAFAGHADPFSKPLAAGLATFGVVVAGFTATQRSMLLGMGGSKVLRFTVKRKYHLDALGYLSDSIFAGVLVSVLSVAWFFCSELALLWPWWLGVWAGAVVLVLATMVRNEWMMYWVVRRFMEDPENQ